MMLGLKAFDPGIIMKERKTTMNILSKFENNIPLHQNTLGTLITSDGCATTGDRELSREHHITIYINETPVYNVVCSPCDLTFLVIGRLISEGIIRNAKDIEKLYLCEYGTRAKVYLSPDVKLEYQDTAAQEVASCCTDNKTLCSIQSGSYSALTPITWDKRDIFLLSSAMNGELPLYNATHAVHSAFLALEGHILYSAEDLGRHNALDKVIGHAVADNIDLTRCVIFTSGRVPVDMVSKVIRARIPVFIGKGAPTADAVSLARQYNLTLVCHAHKDSAILY